MTGHWWILLILAAIALIIFGPRRLPELGEGLGRAIKEFRKATTDVTDSIRDEVRRTDGGTTYTGTATPADPLAQPPSSINPAPPPPEPPKA
ncbi:MAG TPA: twin-arginine translocase TatA/TatE family subunit [Candidatus Dormibacteraeota bacterium]|jgi:sec-independent protein translocase protein TatA|nr:twin-arginine translocase TatA/TatE family subunit [Candidatus Dormibacteraeota bacterium]